MDIMNIADLSMSMKSIELGSDVGTAMLKKSLDTMETTGAGLQKMMESSVTPYLGQNIDYYV